MIRLRPSNLLLRAAAVGSLLPCLVPVAQAQSSRHSYTTTTSIETTVERERARRAGFGTDAGEATNRGDADVIRLDYESAVNDYRQAVDNLNDAPATSQRRKKALEKFFNATIELANERIVEGRYLDAETVTKVILLPQYDPGYKPAIHLLKDLEDPDYFNQTIGPKFVTKVNQVKQLFRDAQGYYDSARYDLAFKRYEQVLQLDPYNDAARMGEEKIDRAKYRHSEDTGYPETRARLLADLESKWEMPVPKRSLDADPRKGITRQHDETGVAAMNAKLAKIIIPNIEFRSTTISDAIEFLRQEARRLDPDPIVEDRGVNIFLKLPTTGARTVTTAAPAPVDPTAIPGLPTDAAPAPAPTTSANSRITLTMSRLPLAEALRYVASQAGLKVKVEQFAVSIVPLSEQTEELLNQEYRVSPNFISSQTTGGAGTALNQAATQAQGGGGGGGSTDNTGVGTVNITRQDAKTFLEQSGVTFPPGASAVYLPSSSKLVVRNTQENLDLIDSLVQQETSVIKQVEIESKFVEITQQNLKELSFDWSLGQANVPGSTKVFFGGGTTSGASAGTTDFPFQNNGSAIGGSQVTSGLRSGTFGISANAIDALLFGGGAAAAAPGIFSVAGVFTDPQFQVVVRALNQQKGVDLLSAPRVTTKSGQKATIEIIREFIYPTQFQPPQIPQNFNAGGGTNVSATGLLTGGGSSSSSFPVTPTTPTNFEKRNTGVTLEVEPVIGPDNYTIDLNLQPQVVDFDGFINYGSPIQTSTTNALGISTPVVLTPNVINQPVFDTRKVSTSVSVYDGSTVVLGGLVREDIQKVNDKVPILGDVPLLGRLFRSKIDQNIKRNLVIFVTAHLIDPAGQLILNNEEEEEVVQPLNGPDYVAPTRLDQIPMKK